MPWSSRRCASFMGRPVWRRRASGLPLEPPPPTMAYRGGGGNGTGPRWRAFGWRGPDDAGVEWTDGTRRPLQWQCARIRRGQARAVDLDDAGGHPEVVERGTRVPSALDGQDPDGAQVDRQDLGLLSGRRCETTATITSSRSSNALGGVSHGSGCRLLGGNDADDVRLRCRPWSTSADRRSDRRGGRLWTTLQRHSLPWFGRREAAARAGRHGPFRTN
jgi:hypothetical protein